jgi:hypothetical protein
VSLGQFSRFDPVGYHEKTSTVHYYSKVKFAVNNRPQSMTQTIPKKVIIQNILNAQIYANKHKFSARAMQCRRLVSDRFIAMPTGTTCQEDTGTQERGERERSNIHSP